MGWSSYRVVLRIGALRHGHEPPEVLTAAVESIAARYPVEDRRVDLLGGVPVVTVRFAVGSPARDRQARERAWAVVDDTATAVDRVAQVLSADLSCRTARGRWLVVRRPVAADAGTALEQEARSRGD